VEAQVAVDQANTAKGELVVARDEHEKKLAGLDAAHKTKLAAREDVLRRREAAADVKERELQSGRSAVSARERAVEQRSADLGARYRSGAA